MIKLEKLDHTKIKGIYGEKKNLFPERFAYLHPAAAASFLHMAEENPGLVLSDMYRSAAASLARRYPTVTGAPRKGVAAPGFSAHNFGLAIDVAVERSMKSLECSKYELDEILIDYGWHCHRVDHKLKSESWHYNYLGSVKELERLDPRRVRPSTARAVENAIRELYSRQWSDWKLDQVQTALAKLNLYDSAVDGLWGPFTEHAVRAFQRAWRLPPDGKVTENFVRTLWFISATAGR